MYSIKTVIHFEFVCNLNFIILLKIVMFEENNLVRGYKTFSMLNSAEHGIHPAHDLKISTIVGILIYWLLSIKQFFTNV